MREIYEKEIQICPSLADASGRLGVPDTFGICMDIASAHAEELGVGFKAMAERGLFWLTVKTQLHFLRRPLMMSSVTARTWPEAPGKLRCCRSYELTQDGETLIAGKTEWAIIGTQTHRLTPAAEVYPEGLAFPPSACAGPFARVPDDFEDAEAYAAWTVRSTDIDVGGHMNNAAYVRMLIGSLSNAELKALRIRRMDVIFRAPCFEGEQLRLYRRPTEDGLALRAARGEETVLLACVERQ